MRSMKIALALACAFGTTRVAHAQDEGCPDPLPRANVVPCALAHSLALEREALTRTALDGRHTAANPLVPSNPFVTVSVGIRRSDAQGSVPNWYLGLGQEIEIGGQRGLRLDAATADLEAEDQRMIAVRRGVVADAYEAYFAVLGGQADLDLARRLEVVALAVSNATQATAQNGLAPGVDADIAEAAGYRAVRARIEAEGRLAGARIALTTALGLDPTQRTMDATGDLLPLAGVEVAARGALGAERPEVKALEDEARAWQARASTFRRSRIPNVTVSAFLQDDGFHERVFGFGLSLPIPFPQPVGRTNNGEIAESEALARRDVTEAARAKLLLAADVLRALAEYDARTRARDATPKDRLDRAETTLQSIAQEVTAGRIATRDAIVAEQALIDMLHDAVRARLAVCLGSVDVARAASLPLERGGL